MFQYCKWLLGLVEEIHQPVSNELWDLDHLKQSSPAHTLCTHTHIPSLSPHTHIDHLGYVAVPGVRISGRFRNPERGVQPLAREVRPQIFGLSHPLPTCWKSEPNISKQL